ncbi:MAG: HAD family hydrolase [Candidatus Binataceae bacterium]
MASICGLDLKRFEGLYRRLRPAYDRGQLNGPEYWTEIATAAHLTLSAGNIRRLVRLDIRSWARLNVVLLGWLESLRAAGIRLALLSNMPIEERNHFGNVFPWFTRFDHLSISCDMGSAKPEVAIFRHCIEGLSARPGQACS